MDGTLDVGTVKVERGAYGRARVDLVAALRLLDQSRATLPPLFVERFRACVSLAIKELGMTECTGRVPRAEVDRKE